MLLRPPPTPLTESVALIGFEGDVIHAYIPEKRDDFKRAVNNRECFWNWGSRRYERTVDEFTGPAPDRAAELAHVLLTTGFCVELADGLGQMILTGSYQPEKRRRIGRSANRKYDGWLTIRWPHDDDLWKVAWALPGSRYDKPVVVVPPDQYEAVLDFADRFDFWITPAGQQVIDEAIARKRAALILEVPPLLTAHKAPLPAMAPATGEIDPDLADDL